MNATTEINPARLDRAKFAYTSARVPRDGLKTLLTDNVAPRSGDLVLAKVA